MVSSLFLHKRLNQLYNLKYIIYDLYEISFFRYDNYDFKMIFLYIIYELDV